MAAPPVAVVTGATGTLGRLLVADLAGRGMRVLAVSRSGAGIGVGESWSVAADLASAGAVMTIRAALPPGDLAMAVHAVGLPGSPGVLDVDPAELGRAVDLKAGGLLRLLDAVGDRLVAGSRIVAVGGHLGAEPSEHSPLAGVANAALANLVRQLAGPLGRRGATVHLVAPGPFDSPRVDGLVAARAVGDGVTEEEARRVLLAQYPSGRLPRAEEVAGVITMLLEPGAAALHGATLSADGGIRRGIL
ncbi:MAG: SDR family oxidoreductase [Candidatus Nanopelagicales bacterium]